jgi:hypothetical protein
MICRTNEQIFRSYITFIAVATIGLSEIIDISHNPVDRLLTIFIATADIQL